jgi:signal transduction histidine kinase
VSDFATLLWIPTGLSFAALYCWGLHFWPCIAVGAFITNFWIGAPISVAFGMSIGNSLEAFIGVWLFLRFAGPHSRLEKVSDVSAFILCGAVISCMISATFGVGSLVLFSGLKESFFRTWTVWWAGDALSNLIFGAFLLVWRKIPQLIGPRARMLEGSVLITLLAALCFIIFGAAPHQELQLYIRSYWIFVFLIWATLRFGQPANTAMVLGLFSIAVSSTISGYGPYHADSLTENLFHLHTFLSAVAISGLYFAALGSEKEEALRLRTDFISIASHELRSPLTSFEVSLHFLKTVSPDDKESHNQVIESLDRQSRKMAGLVDSLLNVAKIETGNLVMDKQVTDLSALVVKVASDLTMLFQRTKCSVELEIQPMVKHNCSAYGMEQVLTNLLMNAMKYGAGTPVKITLSQNNGQTTISVRDEGQGIAEEHHERIFERYERVKKGNSTQGLGLGLYISKLIVDAHKGEIGVESTPGKGATFTVKLPGA